MGVNRENAMEIGRFTWFRRQVLMLGADLDLVTPNPNRVCLIVSVQTLECQIWPRPGGPGEGVIRLTDQMGPLVLRYRDVGDLTSAQWTAIGPAGALVSVIEVVVQPRQ